MMVVHNSGRTVSTITSQYIDQQSPMATVADLVAAMPGVVSASDGTGTTTFQNFNMRGMDSTEIGMVFEGMPASNAFTYSAYTPSLVDSQNMGSISVTQGSVDINAPVYNATGGQISIALRKPSDKMRVKMQASGGSFDSHKEFARIDSGEIGNSGVRTFISASHQSADLWRGYGGMERYHVDAALTKQWSHKSETEVLFGWNQSNSIRMYYPSADNIVNGAPVSAYSTNNDPTSGAYYKYATKSTNSIYGTIKNHFDFGHGLSLDAQGYSIMFTGPYTYGRNFNVGKALYSGTHKFAKDTFAGQVTNAVNGKALTVGSNQWSSQNSGLNLTGTWKHKFNTLKLGYWYSYAVADAQETYFPVTNSGQVVSTPLQHDGHLLQDSNYNMLQQLNQLSLDDRMSFFHRKLTIDAGIRVAMASRQTTNNLPMTNLPYRRTQINNTFVPAPQMLITYRFNDQHQIYVNATTGYHLPAGSGAQSPSFYPTSASPSSTPINKYKPEYMINEEIGYRYNGPVMFNAAGFHYTVQNYQVTTTTQLPGCGSDTASGCLASQLTNAGTLEAFGAQFELATRPWHHFSGYMTGSYLHTRINNNIATKGVLDNGQSIDDYLQTKGKRETSAPEFMGTLGLSYDDGTTFGRFNLHYVGRQYATLVNDASIPFYFTADLSLGRRLPKFWRIASMATLNISNMGNNHYLSYIYGSSNSYRNVRGTRGSTISGSAPTYGIAQGLAVTAGLSGTFE